MDDNARFELSDGCSDCPACCPRSSSTAKQLLHNSPVRLTRLQKPTPRTVAHTGVKRESLAA